MSLKPKHKAMATQSDSQNVSDDITKTLDEISESDSDEEDIAKSEPLNIAAPGSALEADQKLEQAFEELEETVIEIANTISDADLSHLIKKLEELNSFANGRYQDILPQVTDGRKFIIDGDSLLLYAYETKGLSRECGGQTLHIIYVIEKFLLTFISRGLNFVIVFFEVWNRCWSQFPDLNIARNALKLHLCHNQKKIPVISMASLWSKEFFNFLEDVRPGFIMLSSSLPNSIQEKASVSVQWLQFVATSQMVYCDFLCLDVVDIESVHSTTVCLMATIYVHYNMFKKIHKAVLTKIENTEKSMPSPSISSNPIKFPEGSVKISTNVVAAALVLRKDVSDDTVTVVKTVLLSLAFLEHLPFKMRCFKNLPVLPMKVTQILSNILREVANVLNNLPIDADNLVELDFSTIGDMWQGLFFAAVSHIICEMKVVECGALPKIVSDRYEQLISYLNELMPVDSKIQPYPLEHICEGICNDHVLAVTPAHRLSKMKLLPTSCKLTELFGGELPAVEEFSSTLPDEIEMSYGHESRHWHSKKPMTDEFERIPDSNAWERRLEINKRYSQHMRNTHARFNTIYGLSLEGRSSVKAIVVNTDNKKNVAAKKNPVKPKAQAKEKLSKSEKIIQENKKRITEAKLKQVQQRLKSLSNNFTSLMLKGEYSTVLEKCNIELQHAREFPEPYVEILFLKGKACFGLWRDECHVNPVSKRNCFGATQLFLVIREIFKFVEKGQIYLDAKQKTSVALWIYELGFDELFVMKGLTGPPKGSSRELKVEMNHVDFQLMHVGADLLRETGGLPDPRAEGFIPDAWQAQLFDIIDKNQSVVVVAPTSSGKTYASYYCMEKVVRNNDDDVVVYVCPTKALVNQVHATIYARFKKTLPPGKVLQGVFTRDYRQDVTNCQILVTVPECFEILLLSPRSQTWVKKIKYVIFDEVHCLIGQSGGLSWENAITLIRCPFLALSATIHKPETFCAWLQKVEDFKKHLATKFNLLDRPLDSYKVNLVVHSERHNHLLKNVMLGDGSIQHVHPYSFLNLSASDGSSCIPKHITLSPDEAFELYKTMLKVLPSEKMMNLCPITYFQEKCPSGFLSMQAVQKFTDDLRMTLEGEDMDTQMKVVAILRKVEYSDLVTGERFVFEKITDVMDVLKEREMLPALVFTYNREMVQALPLKLLHYLRDLDDFTEDEGTEIESESETESTTTKNVRAMKTNRRFRGKRYTKKLGIMRGPSMLKSNGSLRGEGHTDEKMIDFIEHRLMKSGHRSQDRFPSMLRRGLGRHYGAMNAKERSSVEMLFRSKILNLVSATGTLALGIHMPCKTVVIAGDSPFINTLEFHQMSGRAGRRGFDKEGHVLFCGLDKRKLETLMTGTLPQMTGNFPLSASLILRLLLLVSDATVEGKVTAEATTEALARCYSLLENGLLYETQKNLKERMRYLFRFVGQLFMRMGIINSQGRPQQDALFLTHLHYHEPGNLAFYHLLKSGVLDKLCKTDKNGKISEDSQLNLMIVLNFLFARLPLSKTLLQRKRTNSVVVLPPLPDIVFEALCEYNREVLGVFSHFFMCVSADIERKYGDETLLPLSQLNVQSNNILPEETLRESRLSLLLGDLYMRNSVCSAFAGLSGNTDQDIFPTSGELTHIREDLNVKVIPTIELNFQCNSYALDFFKHGIPEALQADNGIRAGFDFEVIKDFDLVLKTICVSLSEMLDEDALLLKAMQEISETFTSLFNKAYIR